jgi:transposase-like protein
MSTSDGKGRYPPLFKAEILNRVQNGELVSKIAKEKKMHYTTIYAWMHAKGIKPQFPRKVNTKAKKASNGSAIEKVEVHRDHGGKVRDAILYLRHAKTEILKEVGNRSDMSRSQLLTLLALDALQGE